MSRKSIPLLCYWGGKISHGTQGITYEDSTPKAIKVNREIKYSDLIDRIYELTRIDSEKYKVKIICRYLANGQYVALTIDNDESVDIMLDMTEEKGINCVELYIEKSYIVLFGSHADVHGNGNGNGDARDPSYTHFFVRTPAGKDVVCRMKPETPLHKLMTAFCEREKWCSIDMLRLICAGRQLEEQRTLNEYHISDDAVIHIVLRIRGD